LLALKDDDVRTRRQAARSLGRLNEISACDGLIAALSDSDPLVREGAARALGRLGDAKAAANLVATFTDCDAVVRKTAAAALVQLGQAAMPALANAAQGEDPTVRAAAIETIQKLSAVKPQNDAIAGTSEQ